MSKLEELIQQYCPDGVEYVKLGDVCSVLRGKRLTKSQLSSDGRYKVFHGGVEPIGYYDECNRESNTTMVINVGASAGTVGFSYEQFWSSDGCFCLSQSPLVLGRYTYYYLQTVEPYLMSRVRKAGIPTLDGKVLETLEIPVPPLPVQEEIVRILDTFTELQAELQAELQKRLQQYNFYRDNLLSFKDINRGYEVEWKKLGEVAKLERGKVFSKKYIDENKGDYPVYSSQTANNGELGLINSYEYDGKYLTWTTDGAYAGTVFYRDGKFSITNVCGLIKADNTLLDIRFLFFWLSKVAKDYVYSGMGNPKLMSNQAAQITVPIIPLKEQKRIATILDRFDSLTNDLTAGLPAEIEKRRQQYEYYRDKLLTFKRINA